MEHPFKKAPFQIFSAPSLAASRDIEIAAERGPIDFATRAKGQGFQLNNALRHHIRRQTALQPSRTCSCAIATPLVKAEMPAAMPSWTGQPRAAASL